MFVPDVRRKVIAGAYEPLVVRMNSASLDFTCDRVLVSPDLDVVVEALCLVIDVVKEDVGLVLIPIPPLVSTLDV